MVPEPYKVLAIKYRPAKFSELVGQDTLVKTLKNSFEANRVGHAFLLHGDRGVGKTSTARLIAKTLNCVDKIEGVVEPCNFCSNCKSIQAGRHVDVIEMDGASKTGVNDVREIIETVVYRAASAKFKIYIIDEVHMLSNSAFNALLKTLEEPPKHVKFIFATTEIKKIPLTILSRVHRFDLKRLESSVISDHLEKILELEGLDAEKDALKTISKEAAGSVRDALSILDQVLVNCGKKIDISKVNELLGKISKFEALCLLELIIKGNTKEALTKCRKLISLNANPATLLQELLHSIHLVSIVSLNDELLVGDELTEEEYSKSRELEKVTDTVILTSLWQILFRGIEEIKVAIEPVTSLEMIVFRACHMSLIPPPDTLIQRILGQKSQYTNLIYNLGNNSILKNKENNEILEDKISEKSEKNMDKSEDNSGSNAIREILDIFPGAKINK